jgi:hypothetical protein
MLKVGDDYTLGRTQFFWTSTASTSLPWRAEFQLVGEFVGPQNI